MAKDQTTAELTIKGAARMAKESRKELAEWLREQARTLMKDGDQYAERFRGRYITNQF